ncbi:hypothetical protein [Metabacillus lacus]|nr:hypothetical protein [Metabacillus lacus]
MEKQEKKTQPTVAPGLETKTQLDEQPTTQELHHGESTKSGAFFL